MSWVLHAFCLRFGLHRNYRMRLSSNTTFTLLHVLGFISRHGSMGYTEISGITWTLLSVSITDLLFTWGGIENRGCKEKLIQLEKERLNSKDYIKKNRELQYKIKVIKKPSRSWYVLYKTTKPSMRIISYIQEFPAANHCTLWHHIDSRL